LGMERASTLTGDGGSAARPQIRCPPAGYGGWRPLLRAERRDAERKNLHAVSCHVHVPYGTDCSLSACFQGIRTPLWNATVTNPFAVPWCFTDLTFFPTRPCTTPARPAGTLIVAVFHCCAAATRRTASPALLVLRRRPAAASGCPVFVFLPALTEGQHALVCSVDRSVWRRYHCSRQTAAPHRTRGEAPHPPYASHPFRPLAFGRHRLPHPSPWPEHLDLPSPEAEAVWI